MTLRPSDHDPRGSQSGPAALLLLLTCLPSAPRPLDLIWSRARGRGDGGRHDTRHDTHRAAGPGAVGSRGCALHPCHDPCHKVCHAPCQIQEASPCGRLGWRWRCWSGTHGDMLHVEHSATATVSAPRERLCVSSLRPTPPRGAGPYLEWRAYGGTQYCQRHRRLPRGCARAPADVDLRHRWLAHSGLRPWA